MVTTAPPASSAHSLGAPGVVRHRQGRSPYLASEEPDRGGLLPCPLPQGCVWKPLPPGPEQQELQSALGGEGSPAASRQQLPQLPADGAQGRATGTPHCTGAWAAHLRPVRRLQSPSLCQSPTPRPRGSPHPSAVPPALLLHPLSSRTHRSPLIAPGGWPGGAGPWRHGPGWREGRRIPAL